MANPEEEFEEIDDFFSLADQLARPIGQIQKEQVRQARITFNAALAIGHRDSHSPGWRGFLSIPRLRSK